MQPCHDCSSICKKAREGSFEFLFHQVAVCDGCIQQNQHATEQQKHTYKVVRLNYVDAYWEHVRPKDSVNR